MPNEKQTDFIVAKLLESANINFFPNGSNIFEIQNALSTASKRGTNKKGFPEFTAVVNDFVIVVENKAETKFQANYLDDDKKILLMDTPSITNFAENGALHYALNILEKTNFKKIIAFGCSGVDAKKILIRPIFLNHSGYKIMPTVKNFYNFAEENIERYYQEKILENKPAEQSELENILERAEKLHNDLRDYGQLTDLEKPLVVSAILLALSERDFSTENLTGDNVKTDGMKIFEALSTHMDRVKVSPQTKKDQVLNQFRMIVDSNYLSVKNERLGKTPLRYFAEYLNSNVLTAIVNNTPEDVLGRFYGEFVSYSNGGAGQKLGVVLTPKHITELFADLAQITPNDIVFDSCCGTGGFLISAMHRMLEKSQSAEQAKKVKQNNIHGIELRPNMFSIATTNMILRGDGKSNLICADFFQTDLKDLQSKNFSVGFMNPPYSQSNYSEIEFISRLLDSLAENARCVVIVPQSVMVGKNNKDKAEKKYILENHTLEGVITLNPQTFYGVGTNPVIAVFTAHKPHDSKKLVKFVDFKDDGYKVFKNIGFLPTTDAPNRKNFLLRCWHEGMTAPTSFIIRTEIKPDDEWLHSFYYFNEEIPNESDFEKTMADYLAFEFNMIVHGRGYLFDDEKKNSPMTEDLPPLENKTWKEFIFEDIFEIKRGESLYKQYMKRGNIPYVSASAVNNGISDYTATANRNSNMISLAYDGSIGSTFYQNTVWFASEKIVSLELKNYKLNKHIALFLCKLINNQKTKYNYAYKWSVGLRMNRGKILLPVNEKNLPDWDFIEKFMRRIETKLLQMYREYIERQLKNNFVIPAEKKVWKEFFIEEIFEKIQRGKRLKTADHFQGNKPYISSTAENNGVDNFIGNEKSVREFENCLTIANSGSVGKSFYHSYKFVASDHVTMLSSEKLNKWSYLFISQILDGIRGNYSFNREINDKRIKRQKIMLPVDEKNLPDWEYMEKYMRAKENLLLKKYFEKKFWGSENLIDD